MFTDLTPSFWENKNFLILAGTDMMKYKHFRLLNENMVKIYGQYQNLSRGHKFCVIFTKMAARGWKNTFQVFFHVINKAK